MPTDLRRSLADTFPVFQRQPLPQAALVFWQTLGYQSDIRLEDLPTDALGFAREFGIEETLRADRALTGRWKSIHFLFQLTGAEITARNSLFRGDVDKVRSDSYLFFALELEAGNYARGTLAQIARELNRPFQSPILTLFKNGDLLTLAVVDRRPHKRDAGREVLEKVTLIKDINLAQPHPAHLRILEALDLSRLNVRT